MPKCKFSKFLEKTEINIINSIKMKFKVLPNILKKNHLNLILQIFF